jgi:hypothetical protein
MQRRHVGSGAVIHFGGHAGGSYGVTTSVVFTFPVITTLLWVAVSSPTTLYVE